MYTQSYDYLEHHGIDGQKWGRRNGPPYPLDYKSHSAAEKKKNSKTKLDNYDRKEEKNARKNLKSTYEKAKYAKAASQASDQILSKQKPPFHNSPITVPQNEKNKILDKPEYKRIKERGYVDLALDKDTGRKYLAEVARLPRASRQELQRANAKREMDKFVAESKKYVNAYGDKKIKNLTKDSIDNMSTYKANKFIYNKGATKYYALAGIFGGAYKVHKNSKEFESYLDSLTYDKSLFEEVNK